LAEWPVYELILFHLIGNAVKFSKTGGSISVILSPREVEDQLSLKTCVRDNGLGISEEKLEIIRKSIDQSLNPKVLIKEFEEKPSLEGIGFGLTSTTVLVKLLGGEISFSSIPWYKTEVNLSFAIKRAHEDSRVESV